MRFPNKTCYGKAARSDVDFTVMRKCLVLVWAGNNNDVIIESPDVNGAGFNGVVVEILDGSSTLSGDQALVTYDTASRKLTLMIVPNATTAATLVAAG